MTNRWMETIVWVLQRSDSGPGQDGEAGQEISSRDLEMNLGSI